MKTRFLLTTFILIVLSRYALAQDIKNPSIKVIARVKQDGVTLRWATNHASAWKYANQYGYMVERYTLVKGGKVLPKPTLLKINQEPIKPAPLKDWETLAKQDKNAAIAAQALYGKSFEINTKSANLFEIVNASEELETRYSFAHFSADQSLAIANLMGLKLTDKYIFSGERYLYKIYTLVPASVYKIDTGYVFVEADKLEILPPPTQVTATFADKSVTLSWQNYYETIYSSYVIERSTDGGKTFSNTMANPYLNTRPEEIKKTDKLFAVDSFPDNNTIYYYRIRGRSYFGDLGPPSDMVKGQGTAPLKSAPVITATKIIDNKHASISWEFATDPNLKGFQLAKSNSLSKPLKVFGELLAPDVRVHQMKDIPTSSYYAVFAIDKNGNTYSSNPVLIQLKDSTPPSSPNNLKGIIDTNGIVKLTWAKNMDKDLEGYRIYKANTMAEEFTQVTSTPCLDTLYYDTINLNTLSEKVYYKIVAIDHHFNPSAFSKVLILNRPDTLPPAPPVMINCVASENGISLNWINSSSKDVSKHILYRRVQGQVIWKPIISFDFNSNAQNYTDTLIDNKNIFEYTIAAIDHSNNISYASQLGRAKRFDSFVRPSINKFSAQADRNNRLIHLEWNYKEPNLSYYVIYRAGADDKFRTYKTLDTPVDSFNDTAVQIGQTYKYMLKAYFKDGASSPYSTIVEISF